MISFSEAALAGVIQAKLYPALGAHDPLYRRRLDPPPTVMSGACPVVCIIAPAGYGKTTLMAHWSLRIHAQGGNTAWLNLDPDDNDPARFVRYLLASIRPVAPGIGAATLAQLTEGLNEGLGSITESLAAELANIPERLTLFLDDFQHLDNPTVIDQIDWLLHYAPRQLQFVIGSRKAPPLRLGSLRVRGLLYEFGLRELQFDEDEAHRFFTMRLTQPLSEMNLRQLRTKTEGWPAALELAALALKAEAPADSERTHFIESFAGTDRSIVDYLGEVLLDSLPPAQRSLIMRLALFDRFQSELARRLIDSVGDDALLGMLQRRDLFIVPLDRSGEWFRFHALVGEFFRSRLQEHAPVEAQEALRRGAGWFWQHGYIEEAIGHAIRAEAWEDAAQWLSESIGEIAQRRGELQLVLRWINALPAEWVDRYPRIRIDYAFALSFFPRHAEVRAQLDKLAQIREQLKSSSQPDYATINQIKCAIEFQHALSMGITDAGIPARDAAAAWLARWPNAPGMQRGVIGNVLAFGLKSVGDIDAGLRTIATTRGWLEQDNAYYGLAWNKTLEALLHMKRGTYKDAQLTCEKGLTFINTYLAGHRTHASVLHTLLAALAYERDELNVAEQHVEEALYSLAEYGAADVLILGFLTKARLRFARGDPDSGMAVLQEGRALALRRGLPRVDISLASEACVWLARLQCLEEASRLAEQQGLLDCHTPAAPDDPMAGVRADRAYRVVARLKIGADQAEIRQRLDVPLRDCESRGLIRRQSELLVISAMAAWSAGRLDQARADLEQVLAIGALHNYLRLFIDDLAGLRPILVDLLAQGRPRSAITQKLLEYLAGKVSSETITLEHLSERHATASIELTRRERSILRRLESNLSNKELADALFITEGTLKWHLHNIYGKLGARNRSGALVKARDLNLLPSGRGF